MWKGIADSRKGQCDYINCGRFHEYVGEHKEAIEQYYVAAGSTPNSPFLRLKIAACNTRLRDGAELIQALGGDGLIPPKARDRQWKTALIQQFPDAEDVELSNEVFCGAMEAALLIAAKSPVPALELAIAAMDAAIESRAAESVGYFAGCLAKLLQSFNNTAEEAYYWFQHSTPQSDGDYYISNAKAHYQVGDIRRGRALLLEAVHAKRNTPDANIRDKLRAIYHCGAPDDFQQEFPSCPMELHSQLDRLGAKFKRNQSYFAGVHERFAQVYETLLQLPIKPFNLRQKLATIQNVYRGEFSGSVLFCGKNPAQVAELINRLLDCDIIPIRDSVSYSCSIEIIPCCSRFYTVRTAGDFYENVEFTCSNVKEANKIIARLLEKGTAECFDLICVTGPFTRLLCTKSFLFASAEHQDVEAETITCTSLPFYDAIVVGDATDFEAARKYEHYVKLIGSNATHIHLFLVDACMFTPPIPVPKGKCFLDYDFERPGFLELVHTLSKYHEGQDNAVACLKALDALMNQTQMTMRVMECIQDGHATPSTFSNYV